MTTPSDPRHGAPAPLQGSPSTQEIPVVSPGHAEQPGGSTAVGATVAGSPPPPGQQPAQPGFLPQPPHGGRAHAAPGQPLWPETLADGHVPPTRPATVLEGVQPTGPVDFVPGPPEAASPPAAAPPRTAAPRRPKAAVRRRRVALAGVGLAILSAVLLQLGLLDDDADLWSRVTLWAVFATAATFLGLVALVARALDGRLSVRVSTRLVAAAVLALAVFWLLVILPIVASDPGFLVTASLLALGGALWLGPAARRR